MFTSKGLFSSIACPYSESCVLPKCVFSHPETSATSAETLPSGDPQTGFKNELKSHGKAARAKVEGGLDACVANGQSATLTPRNGDFEPDTTLRSARRRVSPPPLRRGAVNGSTILVEQESALTEPKAKSQVHAFLKPPKVEILNPRMLKQSPASHDLRFRLLKALHEQLARLNSALRKDASSSEDAFVLPDQALITMALDLEEMAAVEKATIYSNVVKNHILAYKRMSVKVWKEERAAKVRAQEEALKASNTPTSVSSEPSKPIDTGLTEEEELAFLPRLFTPIVGLGKHGYVTTAPSEEEIDQAKKGIEAAKGWEVCDRCKARFQVFPGRREEDGALTSGGICTYHWGRPFWQDKLASDPKAKRERKYKCCGQSIGDSTGCTTGDSHVFKVSEVKRLAALLNFEETPWGGSPTSKAVCIDGEMGYTVHGLELIRLTATAWPGGEELLDVLVRPFGEVLDLNSRFSGVWPQQMADAVIWTPGADSPSTLRGIVKNELRIVKSPAAARTLLFQHLSPETPLIGHGLENDLNSVRLIHPTIVDTALLFPHRAGLPYRNGLKALMLIHLHRHIQVLTDGKMDGHDSKEDARAAGDLVRWKIKDEWQIMKRDGWVLENGQLIPPLEPDPPLGAPTGPRNKLTIAFLERESATQDGEKMDTSGSSCALKIGTKRPLADISRDELEEGEVGED